MENSKEQFKSALDKSFSTLMTGPYTKDAIMDLNKYKKEMTEDESLEGGESDKKTLLDIAIKHAFGDKVLTTNKVIDSLLRELKYQLNKGIEVEMEHTNDPERAKEIAMDHLMEDSKYYVKLQKMETKENVGNSAKKEFAKDLQKDPDYIEFKKNAKKKEGHKEFNYGVPNVTSDDPYIKKRKYSRPGKQEPTEATGSGSSGAYAAPLFGGDDEFIKKSNKETPGLKEEIEKVEAKEATGSGSVGGYETPSMWAKSTSKKDWGPSRKTQYKGGSFVQVKKKCTRFPYCNQGDINALKLSKNESVKEAIKQVSKNLNLSEEIIENIINNEYLKMTKSPK